MDWLNDLIDEKEERQKQEKLEREKEAQAKAEKTENNRKQAIEIIKQCFDDFEKANQVLVGRGIESEVYINADIDDSSSAKGDPQLSLVLNRQFKGEKFSRVDEKNEINFTLKYNFLDERIKIYSKYKPRDQVQVVGTISLVKPQMAMVDNKMKEFFQNVMRN